MTSDRILICTIILLYYYIPYYYLYYLLLYYYAIISASSIMHLREVPAAARLISPECKLHPPFFLSLQGYFI
jgi:hypothetical protein